MYHTTTFLDSQVTTEQQILESRFRRNKQKSMSAKYIALLNESQR